MQSPPADYVGLPIDVQQGAGDSLVSPQLLLPLQQRGLDLALRRTPGAEVHHIRSGFSRTRLINSRNQEPSQPRRPFPSTSYDSGSSLNLKLWEYAL